LPAVAVFAVAMIVHAAGEQVLAEREGAVNPEVAMLVKLIESVLNPGHPFSGFVVIETLFPLEAPLTTLMIEEFEVSAIHGTVFPELLKEVPVWTVSAFGTTVPFVIVTHTPPGTPVFEQPVWKPTDIPPVGASATTLYIAVKRRPVVGEGETGEPSWEVAARWSVSMVSELKQLEPETSTPDKHSLTITAVPDRTVPVKSNPTGLNTE